MTTVPNPIQPTAAIARRPRVCIVAPNSWPLFEPSCKAPFGGSEVRASMLARELARRGRVDVAMVIYDHGQPELEVREGISFFRRTGETSEAGSGPIRPHAWWHRSRLAGYRATRPVLWAGLGVAHLVGRPLQKAAKRLMRARHVAGYVRDFAVEKRWIRLYDRIDADVYTAAPGGTYLSAELAFYARQREKTFLYLAASDGDYDPMYKERPNEIGPFANPGWMHLYAIENAAAHVVQTERQADRLKRTFGREAALVLRNPADTVPRLPRPSSPKTVLWVGKSSKVKGPDAILDLAERLTDLSFTIVMNEVETENHRALLSKARSLPNVRLVEYVPFAQIEELFSEAAILVNTSEFEGFPNTFLQAAKYSVPIVSLNVDPDGMLSRHGAGLLTGARLEDATSVIRDLMSSPERRAALGEAGRRYLVEFHDKERIVAEFERLILDRLAGRRD